jgi:hypothetical protein
MDHGRYWTLTSFLLLVCKGQMLADCKETRGVLIRVGSDATEEKEGKNESDLNSETQILRYSDRTFRGEPRV